MSLASRSLGEPPGIVQLAYSSVDGQLLDIGTVQLVQVSPLDLQSFGFYPSQIIQAPRLDQDIEDLMPALLARCL
jgi:hypothetical protein